MREVVVPSGMSRFDWFAFVAASALLVFGLGLMTGMKMPVLVTQCPVFPIPTGTNGQCASWTSYSNVIPKSNGLSLAASSITDDDGWTVPLAKSLGNWGPYLTLEECGYGAKTHSNCAYGFPLFERICTPPEPCE